MKDLLVLLSHGHAGRPDAPLGLGAVVDGYTERDLTPLYMRPMEAALRGHGVPCWTLSIGTLRERQKMANDYGERWLEQHPDGWVVYIPCHMDANPAAGARSLWMYDHRSSGGRRLAAAVADAVGAAMVPDLGRQVVLPATDDPGWPGPWAVLHRIYDGPSRMCAMLAEPVELHAHRPYITPGWLSMIGVAMAKGILDFARARGVQ